MLANTSRLNKIFICTTLLCCFSFLIQAQKDTLYLKSYYENIITRFSYTYKTQDFFFTNKSDSVKTSTAFQTGAQFLLGASVSYKWMSVGYAISINPQQNSRNIDFRVATSYKPLQLQFNFSLLKSLDYSITRNYNDAKEDTVLFYRENNFEIITSRLKIDYVFNYKKYSYKAGFTQTDFQKKSVGSFVASMAISNDQFNLTNINEQTKAKFDSLNGFTNTLIAGVDLGLGYGYNWALRNNWTLSLVDIPNAELQFINAKAVVSDGYTQGIAFVNHFKLGVMYTHNRFFAGFSGYNMITTSKLINGRYSNAYNAVDLYVGWIFDEPAYLNKH